MQFQSGVIAQEVVRTISFPLETMENISIIVPSLNLFLRNANLTIDERMSAFRKEKGEDLSGAFHLSKPSSHRGSFIPVSWTEEDYAKVFFQDGKYGFALGFSPEEGDNTWVACTSFSDGLNYKFTLPNPPSFSNRAIPVVMQLQSASDYEHDANNTISDVLKNYRWEMVLLDLVTEWAQFSRFPAIGLLAAENNRWVSVKRLDRFKMRYDVTAKRFGYRMSEQGIYRLDF